MPIESNDDNELALILQITAEERRSHNTRDENEVQDVPIESKNDNKMHQNNENNHEMDGEDRCNNDKTNASIHQKMKKDNNNNKIF